MPKTPPHAQRRSVRADVFPGFHLATTTFYIQKKQLRHLLEAIQRLQMRDDLTPKFARKLAQQRRAVWSALQGVFSERAAIVEQHKERFPEGHDLAGQPTPVYMLKPGGGPAYKQNADGTDSTERLVKAGAFNWVDERAMKAEDDALLEQISVVECPAFLVRDPEDKDKDFVPELDRFKAVNGAVMDQCLDLEEGSEATIPPTSPELRSAES